MAEDAAEVGDRKGPLSIFRPLIVNVSGFSHIIPITLFNYNILVIIFREFDLAADLQAVGRSGRSSTPEAHFQDAFFAPERPRGVSILYSDAVG